MGTELSPVPTTSSKLDVVRPDRAPLKVQQDDHINDEQAIEARRLKFVEQIAKQHGLEKGKLVIEKDTETGRFVHSFVDPDSGEIIRQWPEADWLKFARQAGGANGLWLDKKV